MKLFVSEQWMNYAKNEVTPDSPWYEIVHNEDNFFVGDKGVVPVTPYFVEKGIDRYKVEVTVSSKLRHFKRKVILAEEDIGTLEEAIDAIALRDKEEKQ